MNGAESVPSVVVASERERGERRETHERASESVRVSAVLRVSFVVTPILAARVDRSLLWLRVLLLLI